MPLPKSKRFATPDEALDSTKDTPRLRVLSTHYAWPRMRAIAVVPSIVRGPS